MLRTGKQVLSSLVVFWGNADFVDYYREVYVFMYKICIFQVLSFSFVS